MGCDPLYAVFVLFEYADLAAAAASLILSTIISSSGGDKAMTIPQHVAELRVELKKARSWLLAYRHYDSPQVRSGDLGLIVGRLGSVRVD